MAQANNFVVPELNIDIISSRIIDSPTKYVSYTISVRRGGLKEDKRPCLLERRYTEFLQLYTKLRQTHPVIFTQFPFPRKILIGNFSDETISSRTDGFQYLLSLLAKLENIRDTTAVIDFFQEKEQVSIIRFLTEKRYQEAAVLLEQNFRLLNKLFTDRHPKVLQTLCLLVATCDEAGDPQKFQFAQTAVHRFESVSDTDLLRYYVPLLQLYTRFMTIRGLLTDRDMVQERLDCMKRRGIRVDGCPSLLDAVTADYITCNMPST